MEDALKKPGRSRTGAILLAIAAVCLLAAAGLWLVVFGYNSFSLELELLGADPVILEYGDAFIDPGCSVILRGSKFWTEGIPLDIPVQISGGVSQDMLGKKHLEYRAEFFGLEASLSRIVRVVDTQCPEIILTPDPEDLQPAAVYQEAGYRAIDNFDGDITSRVVRTEEEGRILYSVIDSSGNPAEAVRQIPFLDITPPVITLIGGDRITMDCGMPYVDPGFSAWDSWEGDLTALVTASCDREISRYRTGEYTIHYQVSDSSGNEAMAQRTVLVEPSKRPVILYPKEKTIYLTFDDGPGPYTEKLLDVLKRYQIHATFFVVDTGYPELLRRMVLEGHSIGIHTRSHRYGEIYADVDSYFSDLLAMQRIIQDATGVETWLLRFPGGSSNTISYKSRGIMTELTRMVEDAGFAYFDWNVDSGDAGGAVRTNDVIRNIKDGIQQNYYSIVLQHDIHSYSVDAVESIILWGQANGYTFRSLSCDSPNAHHEVRN